MDAMRHADVNFNITFDSMDVKDKTKNNVDSLKIYVDT